MGLRIFIKYKLNTPFARESSFRYTFGALEWLLSLVGAFNESLKQPTLQYRINILPEKRYQCDLWDIFLNVPVLFLLSKNFLNLY